MNCVVGKRYLYSKCSMPFLANSKVYKSDTIERTHSSPLCFEFSNMHKLALLKKLNWTKLYTYNDTKCDLNTRASRHIVNLLALISRIWHSHNKISIFLGIYIYIYIQKNFYIADNISENVVSSKFEKENQSSHFPNRREDCYNCTGFLSRIYA